HANERNFQIAQKENSVIFLEENYEQNYEGFDPNDPESVISLILMQETYLDQSIVAANTIQNSFVNNLNRKDRTVKQAGFVVLKYTYMPSVL
ncbi:MAG TPA: N-acetylmuramoyl-L-alanine amidase, partial [Flavobacteriaceae bacterium]|nr:N-acetylmuramoyl-L-alanine amidase [Flavobacteriaceae bacterium]